MFFITLHVRRHQHFRRNSTSSRAPIPSIPNSTINPPMPMIQPLNCSSNNSFKQETNSISLFKEIVTALPSFHSQVVWHSLPSRHSCKVCRNASVTLHQILTLCMLQALISQLSSRPLMSSLRLTHWLPILSLHNLRCGPNCIFL